LPATTTATFGVRAREDNSGRSALVAGDYNSGRQARHDQRYSRANTEETMSEEDFDKASAVKLLNQIMEAELAGVVRYTHYSLMVFGHNRIPIVSWLRNEATTCLAHANEAGELVTHLGEHPSLKIGALLETHKHGINDILIESLAAEKAGLSIYRQLFDLVRDKSVLLEDYARRMIAEEELHVGEVNKMLRKPGEITQFEA
jgi:bacterioferritin